MLEGKLVTTTGNDEVKLVLRDFVRVTGFHISPLSIMYFAALAPALRLLTEPEFFQQDLAGERRVCFTVSRLHYLADKEFEDCFFAR